MHSDEMVLLCIWGKLIENAKEKLWYNVTDGYMSGKLNKIVFAFDIGGAHT